MKTIFFAAALFAAALFAVPAFAEDHFSGGCSGRCGYDAHTHDNNGAYRATGESMVRAYERRVQQRALNWLGLNPTRAGRDTTNPHSYADENNAPLGASGGGSSYNNYK